MSASLEALLLGRTLVDRYRIEDLIGRGGMSVVYRALDTRLSRPVALKVVALPAHGSAARAELRERLRREAASAAQIPPHPNVVQVYDYGTDPQLDLDFIVMELLRGQDLKQALQTTRPETGEAMRILREAFRGVGAGHRAGIVHRDVKPGNIFLTGEERLETVKILDFGIAKALELEPDDEITQTGQLPHSPAYASPEQLAHGHVLRPASDVYQLGLVAYELLAGERPYDEEQRARLQAGVPVAVPTRGRWAEIPVPVRRVIERALALRPEDRFPDAVQLVEALVAADAAGPGADPDRTLLVSGPPHATPPPHTTSRAGDGRRRSRGVAVMVAGAVLVALVVWGLRGRSDGPPAGGAETEPGPLPAAELAALDEEFRPLIQEAYRNLQEEASSVEGAEAAAAVQRVIADVNQSWVLGELDRHLSHYAERVDFYNADGAPRSRVREERGAQLERFEEREIVIDRQAVEFPEPGRARALVDKSWTFVGPELRWTGSARQELGLELREGRWLIVSERDLEVFHNERQRR